MLNRYKLHFIFLGFGGLLIIVYYKKTNVQKHI